ncbi:hypothetical protein Emed_001110 [Eimeria media]
MPMTQTPRLARQHQQEAGSIMSPVLDSRQRGPEHGSKPSSTHGSDSCSASHEGPIVAEADGFGAVLPEAEHWQISQKDAAAKALTSTSSRCAGTKELVERTREAFLLQMAVDTRKAEILKLHDKAARKTEYLRRAESLLAKDAQKFDEFLRSSDAAAHDAICVSCWDFEHYKNASAELLGVPPRIRFSVVLQTELLQRRNKADNAARVAQEKATAVRHLRQKLDATRARTALNREKEWLKVQEEQSRERVKQQKHDWAQQQMQQQLRQHAAEMEAIEEELREKLQDLDKKKLRGNKATMKSYEQADADELLLHTGAQSSPDSNRQPVTFSLQYPAWELETMEKRFADTRAEMESRLQGLEAVISELQLQLQQRQEGSADCLRMLEQIEAKLDAQLASLAKHEGNLPFTT